VQRVITAINHGHFYTGVYPHESIHKLLAEDSAAIGFYFFFFAWGVTT
jgi:hypothetical protein